MKGKLILLSRAVYAIAWFFVAPAVPGMLKTYGLESSFASLVVSSFFVATGLMQVPSALISARIGAKRAYSLGLMIIGASETALGLARSPTEVLAFYFLTGVGASLFFSSAGGTLARLNQGEEQKAMGLYNALFSVGGTFGLLLGPLETLYGFGPVAVIVGSVTALLGLLNLLSDYPNYFAEARGRNAVALALMALATSGVWGVYYLVTELFPTYVYLAYNVPPSESSLIETLATLASAAGGFSLLLSRKSLVGPLQVLAVSALGVAPAVLIYFKELWAIGLLLLGFFNEMAISVIYAYTLSLSGQRSGTLGLAIINSGEILGGVALFALAGIDLQSSFALATAISLAELAFVIPISKFGSKGFSGK